MAGVDRQHGIESRDGRLRILDLGVAASDGVDFQEINNPGTPSYMAPELFAGSAATVSSDLYAAGRWGIKPYRRSVAEAPF